MSSTGLKPSAFNVVVPSKDDEVHIVYNTANGALALVDDAIAEALNAGGTMGANPLSSIDDEAVSRMSDLGFLVASDLDELAVLEKDHRTLQQDPSTFSLCIAPTYTCNLACPYCYEDGRSASGKIMDAEMQDKIVEFAKAAFADEPYEQIEVQWYGGEPMLAPEAIEHISKGLKSFAEDNGLGFSAYMISNATRIGAEEAAMLSRSCVHEVLVTIDGPESLHNSRRPAKDGSNSYEAVLDGVAHLLDEGIAVKILMNTDKVNDPYLDELNGDLLERLGLRADRTKLNDYYGTFGKERFREPDFSLMDHPEFTRLQCGRFCEEGHAPQEFADLLEPIPLFCRGQKERYYAIDAMGDVYKCDGHMGRPEYTLFNLDEIDPDHGIPKGLAPEYPFDDKMCLSCSLLPLCKGTCEWERKFCEDHPCHPLKYTAEGYLQGWVDSISAQEASPLPEGGFRPLRPSSVARCSGSPS